MQFTNLLAAGQTGGAGTINNPTFGTGPLNQLFQGSDPAHFLNVFLPNAVALCFIIASVIFLFMLVTGAIQWISSAGDKGALESAKGKISNAIIGIVILFATFAVIKAIEGFFGVNILTIDIGPLIIR